MNQCPSCASFNEAHAAFCNQCGRRLLQARKKKKPSGMGKRMVMFSLAILLLAGVAVLIVSALREFPEKNPKGPISILPIREPGRPVRPRKKVQSGKESEPEPLTAEALRRLAGPAIVLLELFDEGGERLREIRGVLIEPAGTVLCRFHPLLGAYDARCLVGRGSQPIREIQGLVAYDPYGNLALLEISPEADLEDLPSLPVASTILLEPGMDVVVLSLGRVVTTQIADYPFFTPDGVSHGRLDDDPQLPQDAVVVMDVYGSVIGLCTGDPARSKSLPVGLPDSELVGVDPPPRILVDPLTSVSNLRGRPAILSLSEATRRFYEGTFAFFLERAGKALEAKKFFSAIDLLGRALDQAEQEGIEEKDIEEARRLLRRSIDGELSRLRRDKDSSGMVSILEIGVEHFPHERKYWIELGTLRLNLEEYREAIGAFLEARQLKPDSDADALLQEAYLNGSAREIDLGRLQVAAEWLEKGIQVLPDSARLHLELAKLYQRWGFYDDAVRVFQMARARDPGLAVEIDAALEEIDAILRNRDVLVLKLPEGSSTIRTDVMLNGHAAYPFVIDTGATFTSISQEMAEALGYQISPAMERVVIGTANGIISAPMVVLDSLDLHGYTVRNLKAIVLPRKAQSMVGLLGLNFLDHFRYSVDAGRKEFRLERR